jgi:hypothetical protein
MGARALVMVALPWLHMLSVITDTNYAANFYIYVLSGKKFRQELRRVLRIHRFRLRFTSTSGAATASRHTTREELILS